MPNQIEQIINLMFEAKKLLSNGHKHRSSFSPLHLRILHYISRNQDTVMKDIADLCGITPPSATSLVEGMVKSGLITRTERKSDRRIVHLKITKKGQAMLKSGFQRFTKKIREALHTLTHEERETLIRIIKKISSRSKN
jgi:DNA-binding MarR family transcriptional regulator